MRFLLTLYLAVLIGCATPSATVSKNKAEYNVSSVEQVKLDYLISLTKLDQNSTFKKETDSSYSAASGAHKISIAEKRFKSKKEAMTFLYTRRTYLHQAFSTLIAPYYGIVQANAECMKLVDVKGDLKKFGKDEYVSMSFGANRSEQLVDCHSEMPAYSVKYTLYLCHQINSVFEVKVLNQIGSEGPGLHITCI